MVSTSTQRGGGLSSSTSSRHDEGPLVPLVTMRRGHKYQRCAAKFSFLFFFFGFANIHIRVKVFRHATRRDQPSSSLSFHEKEREEWASKVRLPFFFITLYYVSNPPTAGSLTKGLDFNTRRKDDPSSVSVRLDFDTRRRDGPSFLFPSLRAAFKTELI